MIPARFRRRDSERGQGLVELALIVPIIIALFVTTAEVGLIYGKVNSIGYASREGARAGSALASGGVRDCEQGNGPAEVDRSIIASVERILTSPDSGIALDRVEEIRLFEAHPTTGAEQPLFEDGNVEVWTYAENGGPLVDEVEGREVRLNFKRTPGGTWPSCERENGAGPDSIGVTIRYRYEYVTPLPVVVNAISGGSLEIGLTETTVMALNPTVLT